MIHPCDEQTDGRTGNTITGYRIYAVVRNKTSRRDCRISPQN